MVLDSLHITQLPQFTSANEFEMLVRHPRDHRQKLNSPFENYPIHVVLTLCRMRMIPMQSSEVECRQNSDPRYMTKMTECCRIPQLITAVGVLTLCTHITMPSNDNQRMRPHHSEIARESEWVSERHENPLLTWIKWLCRNCVGVPEFTSTSYLNKFLEPKPE